MDRWFLAGTTLTVVAILSVVIWRIISPPALSYTETVVQQEALSISLHSPKSARLFQEIPLYLELKNLEQEQVRISVGAHDFIVRQPDGEEIWRENYGEVILARELLLQLNPGEVYRRDSTWNQRTNKGLPILPGTYDVYGSINIGGLSGSLEIGPLKLRIGL